jgi:hypothetical protein
LMMKKSGAVSKSLIPIRSPWHLLWLQSCLPHISFRERSKYICICHCRSQS